MARPVYYYTHVDGDAAHLAAHLTAAPSVWLPAPAEADGADHFLVRLACDGLLPAPGVLARIQVGAPLTLTGSLIVLRLSWRAAVADVLFPVMDADLELTALTPDRSQLTLAGSYHAPLSVVGAGADRLVGRHIADGVVRDFVLAVAARLQAAPTMSA